MKRKAILLSLVIVLLLSQVSYFNTRANSIYFSKGSDYIEMPDVLKIPYVMGMLDILYTLLYGLKPTIYQELEERTKSMSLDQFVKIYDNFLDEKPELLHHPTGTTFVSAIFDAIFPELDFKEFMKFE
jgi:hypothetical protein